MPKGFFIRVSTRSDGERLIKEIENMPRNFFRPIGRSQGFTLVEMIGVLAIIAILIAMLLPKIFTVIASSNARSLAAAIRTYETAIVKYYADVGTVFPLNANGVPAANTNGSSATLTSLPARLTLDVSDPLNTGANQWIRFRGPYLKKI
jgi:prepilin-type N-terminal cleavage/methylation domain-containing protein